MATLKKAIKEMNAFFSREETKGEIAWGIIHDAIHVAMTNGANIKSNKMTPESTLEEYAAFLKRHKLRVKIVGVKEMEKQ